MKLKLDARYQFAVVRGDLEIQPLHSEPVRLRAGTAPVRLLHGFRRNRFAPVRNRVRIHPALHRRKFLALLVYLASNLR